MEVGVLAVEEEGVWAPDLVEELPVHGELRQVGLVEGEARVGPVLAEVAVEGEPLVVLLHWPHRPDENVHLEMEGEDGPVAVDLPDIRNRSMMINDDQCNDHTNISIEHTMINDGD